MWNALVLLTTFFFALSTALKPDPIFSPFIQPFSDLSDLSDLSPDLDNTTYPELELLKRQNNGCPSGSNSCAWLNSGSNLCCKGNAVCSVDSLGHIACCPQGAVCTGTIAGTATATTTPSSAIVGAAATSHITTTTVGGQTVTVGVAGTTTSTGSGIVFVQATGGTTSDGASTKSYVPNPYFPFPYIPTTYANAAACSHAYSTCQSNAASCTAYLLGSPNAGGVTISAPDNQGTTVAGPTTTYASSFASAVCSTLSSSACYGLVVEACGNFGSGSASAGAAVARCSGVRYGVGVGAAGAVMGMVGFR